MDREQIIKALECCSDGGRCNDCPYDSDCFMPQWVIVKDAFALIRELTEENERLKAENESLKTQRRVLAVNLKDSCKREIAAKADTVREMQERLKKAFNFGHTILEKSICDIIDQIAKELLEEDT